MSIHTQRPSWPVRRVIVPATSIAWPALTRRFMKTWLSCAGMQRTSGSSPNSRTSVALYFNSLATTLSVLARPWLRSASCHSALSAREKSLRSATILRTRASPSADSPISAGMSSRRKSSSAARPRPLGGEPRRVIAGKCAEQVAAGVGEFEQAADVVLERTEVGTDETDRIVDLVRDAGGQLADGSHLFRLQQLALRALDGFHRCVQGALLAQQIEVGLLQLARARFDLPLEIGVEFGQTSLRRLQLRVAFDQRAVALRATAKRSITAPVSTACAESLRRSRASRSAADALWPAASRRN
jgi:hypothetical protein